MFKLRCLLLSAALAIASAVHATGNGTVGNEPAPAFGVVTLNIHHDKDDWPQRRARIARVLRCLQPDAVALQEVIQNEHTPNQAQWLAEELGYQWRFVSTDAPDKPLRYGNALLTRHPILQHGEVRLRPLDDHRTAGWLRLDWSGQPLNLYVTHLHWTEGGGELRREQVAHLMDYIHATADDAPIIVASDFNAVADAAELAALRADFRDSYGSLHPGADPVASSTLDLSRYPPKRIDHVFFQHGRFTPVVADIILRRPDAASLRASDHYGLHVILQSHHSDAATAIVHTHRAPARCDGV